MWVCRFRVISSRDAASVPSICAVWFSVRSVTSVFKKGQGGAPHHPTPCNDAFSEVFSVYGWSLMASVLGPCHVLFPVEPQSVSSRTTVCFQSNHGLFPVEPRSVSSRSTVCFQSNHSLFPVEAQSVSSRTTVCFQSMNHASTVVARCAGGGMMP